RVSKYYVVIKNNHYIFVDACLFLLHHAAVSLIGSAGKDVLNRLGKPSRCSPDTGCPQGRLMKLTRHDPSDRASSWRNVLMILVADLVTVASQIFGFRYALLS
ncbi:hypothetical protein K5D57_23030, partial [Pseudomonas cichorii]|nr:hypothetical protein [Pseudomonas cichorii]